MINYDAASAQAGIMYTGIASFKINFTIFREATNFWLKKNLKKVTFFIMQGKSCVVPARYKTYRLAFIDES